jgi:choline dehydrogenase-like flavoprotein
MCRHCRRVFGAKNALFQPRRQDGLLAAAAQHLLGGTIMGTSAENSVINSYGQSHEIANLYVAGCGIFPIESSANPTFTLNALSLRGRRAACGQLGEHRG